MRLNRISVLAGAAAVVAFALTVLPLAGPAVAQEAGDCDMLCRLGSYLSTDHMTVGAGEPGSPRPSTKARHARAVAHKAPTARPPGAARPTVARAAAASRPASITAAVPRRAPPSAAAVAPTAHPAKAAASAPARRAAPAAIASVAAARPVDARRVAGTPKAVPAVPKAAPTIAARAPTGPATPPTHTASLPILIPGSAPAMQAGFH